MIVTLQTRRIQTLEQVRAFLEGSETLDIEPHQREASYAFVADTLRQFGYTSLGKGDKGLIVRYLCRITGRSRQQMTRLIAQFRATGAVRDRRGAPAKPFAQRYTRADIRALAQIDADHGTLSGPATRKLCQRAWHVFGEARFQRLAAISNGHLYNLRQSRTYRRQRGPVDTTKAVSVAIGERRKPRPDSAPGFLRIDSVHQGDLDGAKGLYHINVVDEVTQFQFVASVERISERYLVPALEGLLQAFPFAVEAFHADNGSEYINHRVAGLLDKLHIGQFTKSRARQTNDNALVESKNGSVVRKHLGYAHIPQRFAGEVNAFHESHLAPYLNYHRPCYFPTEVVDAKGRMRKRYRQQDLMTPYEKLKSLPDAERYLKSGITFDQLDAIAYAISDNQAAQQLNQARQELFRHINESLTCTA